MRAVVYKDSHQVAVEDVSNPQIEDSRDAILRITSAAICGSDLHMYDGRTNIKAGTVFGHENMGIIEEVGKDVKFIKKGDRVVLPFNISCGTCLNCTRGETSACLTANPEGVSAAYGYAEMGPYRGGQADFLRIPFADFNCLKLPGKAGDEYENDFLMLADIFPTGYHACELAKVGPGSTVAIFGAGPVGLLAVHSAFIRGASEVYIIDHSEARLNLAEKFGATPINFEKGDPAEQIFALRKQNSLAQETLREGEDKMPGVMCGIDAVGYQALDLSDPLKENPSGIIKQLIKVVNPTGAIGIIGVFVSEDKEAEDPKAKEGVLEIPWGEIFKKGLTIGMGQTPVKKYNILLRDLIIANRAKPGRIISHEISLDQASEAYQLFDLRGMREGKEVIKIVLKPQRQAD